MIVALRAFIMICEFRPEVLLASLVCETVLSALHRCTDQLLCSLISGVTLEPNRPFYSCGLGVLAFE